MFRQRARGLFDLLMASLAVATLMTTTPAGELIGRGLRWALGVPSRPTDLLSFFGSKESQARIAALTAPEAAGLISTLARAYGAEPAVLKGFALASGADPATPDQGMRLTAPGRALLLARGAKEDELTTGSGRLRAVGRALPELTRALGSADAALCALVLGLEPAQHAAERVQAERREPTLEALSSHLSPGSREQAERTVGLALQLATAYDLAWPVPRTTRIASRFGPRVHPITGAPGLHTGVDLSVPTGTPVWSAGRGLIKRAGEDGVNGKFLVVDHGRGITSAYCHNSELLAARGGRVDQGATIAHSGNTGRSTGPHLHYQVAIEGVPVDPLALFSEGDKALVSAVAPVAPKVPPKAPTPSPAKLAPKPTKATPTPAKVAPDRARPAAAPAKAEPASEERREVPEAAAPALEPAASEPEASPADEAATAGPPPSATETTAAPEEPAPATSPADGKGPGG